MELIGCAFSANLRRIGSVQRQNQRKSEHPSCQKFKLTKPKNRTTIDMQLSRLILSGKCYSTVSMLALNTCLVGLSQCSYTRWLYKCNYASRAESVTVINNMNLFEHTSTRTRLIKAIGNTTCTYEDLSGSMI